MELLLPLLIVFMVGMMFVSSRQRRRQQQQAEELQNSIAVGDVVRMTCGISGTVVDTQDEQTIDIEIAEDVVTTWLRAAVREKLTADAEVVEAPDDAATLTGPGASADDTAAVPAGPGAGAAAVPSTGATPPTDAVGGTPTAGADRTTSAAADRTTTSGEVSSPRSS